MHRTWSCSKSHKKRLRNFQSLLYKGWLSVLSLLKPLIQRVKPSVLKVMNLVQPLGRPRRCGWLDLPALKYAIDINGVTELMMMKADVLSGIGNLKICTAYRYKGDVIEHLPYKLEEALIEQIFTEIAGWNEDLTTMISEDEFPDSFKAYIDFIEKEVGVPISLISVGPDRAQTIMRK